MQRMVRRGISSAFNSILAWVIAAAGSLVIGLILGFLNQIRHFPWYADVFLILAGLLIVAMLLKFRKSVWEQIRMVGTHEVDLPGQSFTQFHVGGHASVQGSHLSGVMQVGGYPEALPELPIPAGVVELRERADELDRLGRELDEFNDAADMARRNLSAQQRETAMTLRATYTGPVPSEYIAMTNAQMVELEEQSAEWARRYVRDFDARVIEAYEDARRRGFVDALLEKAIRQPGLMGAPAHPSILRDIAQRLKVIGLRMKRAAGQTETN